MLYSIRYNLSATSGYFYLTISDKIAYYQFEPVKYEPANSSKFIISFRKQPKTSS